MFGYLHSNYAASLAEFGVPRELPGCGGWILERPIPGSGYRDAMGCYPLFCCQDWSQLHADLESLGDGLVTLALVTDPFGDYDVAYLQRCFLDVVIPFKEHFVTDLNHPVNDFVSRNRRKRARRALKEVSAELCSDPMTALHEWETLYAHLVERHAISGLRAFSHAAFAKQLEIPGMVMFRAVHRGATVAAALWYVQGEIAYGHLAACDPIGYELNAAYALDWYAIEYFAGKVRWLDWGGGAGITAYGTDGLSAYKRGWSTHTRPVYFCGRIYDRKRYAELSEARGAAATSYFPAYRWGEFSSS